MKLKPFQPAHNEHELIEHWVDTHMTHEWAEHLAGTHTDTHGHTWTHEEVSPSLSSPPASATAPKREKAEKAKREATEKVTSLPPSPKSKGDVRREPSLTDVDSQMRGLLMLTSEPLRQIWIFES